MAKSDLVIDINLYISSDATSITITDDTQAWGTDGIDKSNILVATLEIYDDELYTTLLHTEDVVDILGVDGSVEIDIADFSESSPGTELPNGVYGYKLSYTHNVVGFDSPVTKDDGVFFSTRLLEQGINDDLLDLLTGVQAYNYKMDFPKLEELRRRDNILFAIEAAEFLSQIDNVKSLIDFSERLE